MTSPPFYYSLTFNPLTLTDDVNDGRLSFETSFH